MAWNDRGFAWLRANVKAAVSLFIVAVAPLLAGCATEAEHRGVGASIAFESIDGPPPEVFERLVAHLDAEANTRKIAVVSRRAPARYRVRAYLAAKIEPSRTSVAWVWDVYDSDLQRATRIAGEEPLGRARQDAWAAADDQILGRIAESGMRKLALFVAGRAPPESRPTVPDVTPQEPRDPAPSDEGIQVAAAVPSSMP